MLETKATMTLDECKLSLMSWLINLFKDVTKEEFRTGKYIT